jgi:hypothetical protein
MKNFLKCTITNITTVEKNLQDHINEITSLKLTKQEFLQKVENLPSDLSLYYQANFSVNITHLGTTIYVELMLNRKTLLTFSAEY